MRNKLQTKRMRAGLCKCGAMPEPHAVRCEPCLEKQRIYNRRRYADGGRQRQIERRKAKQLKES